MPRSMGTSSTTKSEGFQRFGISGFSRNRIFALFLSLSASFLMISINDNFSFDLSLDSNNDGVYDFTWQYVPVAAQTNTLENIWEVYHNGSPGPDNEIVEFSGDTFSYRNDFTEFFSGTFVDTSDLSMNRLQITVTSSTNPDAIGKTGNCIYQFSAGGTSLTLACNDPGASGYPQDFTPATGVLILDLVLP